VIFHNYEFLKLRVYNQILVNLSGGSAKNQPFEKIDYLVSTSVTPSLIGIGSKKGISRKKALFQIYSFFTKTSPNFKPKLTIQKYISELFYALHKSNNIIEKKYFWHIQWNTLGCNLAPL
jgi:hypothetical protein